MRAADGKEPGKLCGGKIAGQYGSQEKQQCVRKLSQKAVDQRKQPLIERGSEGAAGMYDFLRPIGEGVTYPARKQLRQRLGPMSKGGKSLRCGLNQRGQPVIECQQLAHQQFCKQPESSGQNGEHTGYCQRCTAPAPEGEILLKQTD